MNLDKVTDRFDRGHEIAQRSAKEQLDLIMKDRYVLLNVRGGREKMEAAEQFHQAIQRGEKLTPNQLSFVDAIYEAMWRGKGFDSARSTFKPRKGLRFPK